MCPGSVATESVASRHPFDRERRKEMAEARKRSVRDYTHTSDFAPELKEEISQVRTVYVHSRQLASYASRLRHRVLA